MELPLIYRGASNRRRLALRALADVGLRHRARHRPTQLSGGEQQRVAIARALVTNPALILADEPTGALDSKTTADLMDMFVRLNSERGITIALVTHELEVAAYTQRVVPMRDGRIVSDGPPEKVSAAAGGRSQGGAGVIIFSMVQVAVMALTTNKLRTALTMLGIVIGVGAVIALMAAGQGAKQGVTKEVSGLGSNLIFVSHRQPQSAAAAAPAAAATFNPFSLTTDDAAALKGNALLPYVDAVVAQFSLNLETHLTGNGARTTATAITATQPDFPAVRSYKVAAGSFFTDDDMTRKTSNVVLGAKVAQDLFDTPANAIGQEIRLSFGPFSLNLTVVGVMEQRGAAGTGTDDTTILVPLTTFQAKVPFGRSPTGQSQHPADHRQGHVGQQDRPDEGSDHAGHARASRPDPGLRGADPGGPHGDGEKREQDADDPPGRHRRHLAGRRRHRHHEHHARVRDGADA